MTRTLLAACALVLAAAACTSALATEPAREKARAEIARLAKMAGEWKGDGWMVLPGGRRSEFESEEKVELRLEGSALLIEGRHRDRATRAVVHHALGLLAWDEAEGEFRMATALANGRGGRFPGRIQDGRFVWTIPAGASPERRYSIDLGEPDRWVETGEITLDGGRTWRRFFEMTLTRVR